jgi:hypothetical protein
MARELLPIGVYYEHPDWFRPLFSEMERRGVPFSERFGGWYVTGSSGKQTHMGNVVAQDPEQPDKLDRSAGVNVSDLSKKFDVTPYLSAHSDIVAQLAQAHQTQMHNLITLTNYRTRIALYEEAARLKAPAEKLSPETPSEVARKQYEGPAEELVKYMLFVDEAPLEDRITGDSDYAREFAARGLRDPQGRSTSRNRNNRTNWIAPKPSSRNTVSSIPT